MFELEFLRNGEREQLNISQAVVPKGALQHYGPVGAEVHDFGVMPQKARHEWRKFKIYKNSKIAIFIKICKLPGNGW